MEEVVVEVLSGVSISRLTSLVKMTHMLRYTGWAKNRTMIYSLYNICMWWRRKAFNISKYSAPYQK